mgnify:CR=1 FL=1
MKRKKRMARALSLFLSVVMLLSSLGTSVLAADAGGTPPNAHEKAAEQTDTGGGYNALVPETPETAQSRTVETSSSEENISANTGDTADNTGYRTGNTTFRSGYAAGNRKDAVNDRNRRDAIRAGRTYLSGNLRCTCGGFRYGFDRRNTDRSCFLYK